MSEDQFSQASLAVLPQALHLPSFGPVRHPASFSYYGTPGPDLVTEATKFLVSRSDAESGAVSSVLNSFLEVTLQDCLGPEPGNTACWFLIRATNPSDYFKVPRWHQDGLMFPYDTGTENLVRSKYAITLLGPRTLMLPRKAHTFSSYKQSEEKSWDRTRNATFQQLQELMEEQRKWLAEQFENEELVELSEGQIVRFSWGRDNSPIHSEPDLVCDRVFVTVLYGSEREIRGMCEWRDKVYGQVKIE